MLRSFTLALLLMLSFTSFGGVIRGDVKDAKDSTAMGGVTVFISSVNRSATTDFNGHYELINVPDGTYEVEFSFTSYKSDKRSVTLAGGGDAVLDLSLASKNNQLKGASVKAARVTKTESAVVLEIRKASVVVSGISAAQISKTQDRNAADVVKRIPGVTIQDDRFITIRGLSDRYNTVWLNDAGAPSSEVDKKSFSFDLIPSGLIDRILIFKTPSAELPGDFAGGMVKIYTSSLPSKNEYNFSLQGSYRAGSTGTDFNYEPRHAGDWIGYDNGSRNLPNGVPNGPFSNGDPGIDIKAITQSFSNDWIINSQKQKPDLRVSGSAANLFRFKNVKLGNTFGFSYTNTKTNYNVQHYDFDDTTENYHYNDLESINKTNLALLDNVVAVIGNSKIEFKNLYNQIGTAGITYRTSIKDTELTSYTSLKGYQLGYENRKTYATQLSGSHHNESESRKYNWTLGYSSLVRNTPDLRRIIYNESQIYPGTYYANVGIFDVVGGGGRLYGNLNENVYSFSHQLTQKITLSDRFAFDLNLGNYIEYKKRNYDLRELGYVYSNKQNLQILYTPLDQLFAADNLGDATKFLIKDGTVDYDHYIARNTTIASFVSVNVPIGNRIKALAGLRYENNRQQLDAMNNGDTLNPDLKTSFLLPSINLTYNFNAKMLLRLAYGKTLNRPEFREQSPGFFYDFSQRAGTYGAFFFQGATGVQVAEVQNIDARWEFYPSAGELIHAGIFYKSFTNPIQTFILGGQQEKSFSFINGSKAYVEGIEIDVRKSLNFVSSRLKNFNLVGNLSLSKSELTIDSAYAKEQHADIVLTGPLQGQSDYVINAGIFYQSDSTGFQGSILYNYYSPRLYAIGRTLDGSIGELGFHSLDLTISKVFAKHYTFTAGVQNLLDLTIRYYSDANLDNKFDTEHDKPYTTYKPGQYFTVGIKARF